MIAHLVTDRRRLCPGGSEGAAWRCLLQQVGYAIEAGVDVIQVRERDLEARNLADLVEAVVSLARGSRTRVVVNDRLDVALASGAHGVHLRSDSVSATAARRLAPDGFVVGRSVHSIAEAAGAADADYLIAGTVWSSVSKPENQVLLGLSGFAATAATVTIPVLAIGGVQVESAGDIRRAGGAGIAAIGLFMDQAGECRAASLVETVAALRRQFDTSGSHS